MDFGTVLVAVTAMGCGTGIVLTVVDKVFGNRKSKREVEARLAVERASLQEAQLVELRRQNDLLQEQLRWHSKLLQAQDQPAALLRDARESEPAIR